MKLFELTNSYDLVYKWLNHLIKERHYVIGYTIMPNHFHGLIAFRNKGRSINSIIGNGKCNDERFVDQKLDYIHENACKGEKPLVDSAIMSIVLQDFI